MEQLNPSDRSTDDASHSDTKSVSITPLSQLAFLVPENPCQLVTSCTFTLTQDSGREHSPTWYDAPDHPAIPPSARRLELEFMWRSLAIQGRRTTVPAFRSQASSTILDLLLVPDRFSC